MILGGLIASTIHSSTIATPFSTGVSYYRHYWDDDINDPFHVTGLSCSGSEYRVTDCQFKDNTVGFFRYDDWGVRCSVGEYIFVFGRAIIMRGTILIYIFLGLL